MNIIIAGCGKVGYNLAEQLNDEGHDVTMIDTNPEKVEEAVNKLDIQGLTGNGTSYLIQKEAGIEESDLMIAVTDQDEVNLLSCLIAKKAGGCSTIARVRNPEYYKEINFIKEELGLSMAINPEFACAAEILRLIHIPSALELNTFAKGRVNLVKVPIPKGSELHNMKVREFSNKVSRRTLICIIQRDQQVLIPDGNTMLQENDNIFVSTPMDEVGTLFSRIGLKAKRIRSVMIAGGDTISYYLAAAMQRSKIQVKIIEKNRKRCDWLSEMLPNAMVICADASERQILLEEGVRDVDAFVSLTEHDEENILLSLYVNKVSKAKVITKINKISVEEILDVMPLGSIVSPKHITAENIVSYVRSKQNSFGSNVETMHKMLDNRVEALEFFVREESVVTGVSLMELNLRQNLLICSINRNGKIITPGGKDEILPGDHVIVVTTNKGLTDIEDILEK
ncbi:MAG: Trk system potassium transporter TrkA [Lachnospiraceae bacterium]|nr:Trk system potassium transporter TrkA [Lachnospiraceae bacterium]